MRRGQAFNERARALVNRESGGSAYQLAVAGLDNFGASTEELIKRLLRAGNVAFHSVDHRVKSEESASQKLADPEGSYDSFPSLHDLLGLRVTCYFSDDVDKVVEIIEKEFDVDHEKSVDKGKQLSPRE